jgi:hypothetical protein
MNRFINKEGYGLVKDEHASNGSTIYRFKLDEAAPLTYYCGSWFWQPNRKYLTDMGSIPDGLQIFPQLHKDRYLLSYMFHDCGYAFKGLHSCERVDGCYKFTPLTRAQVDEMLFDMLQAEGATWLVRWTIYLGVRAGGWVGWGKGDRKKQFTTPPATDT